MEANNTKRSWIYTALGASNHAPENRQANDYYASQPEVINALLKVKSFDNNIWEPACGGMHLSNRLKELGYNVFSTDLIRHSTSMDNELDFLSHHAEKYAGQYDIITNPPYRHAQEFCEQAISLAKRNVAMLLKVQFLEGLRRQELFKVAPPTYVAVFIRRIQCAKNGDWDALKSSSPSTYAWFIWDKEKLNPIIGVNKEQPSPQILWI